MEGSGNAFRMVRHHSWSSSTIPEVASSETGAVGSTSAASPHLGAPTSMECGRSVGSSAISSGGPDTVKMNPDEKCAAAQLKVERLETALAAFGNENSPEKEAIEGFLIRARAQAKVRPVEERLKACEECLAWSLKRLEEVQREVERTKERLSRFQTSAGTRPRSRGQSVASRTRRGEGRGIRKGTSTSPAEGEASQGSPIPPPTPRRSCGSG